MPIFALLLVAKNLEHFPIRAQALPIIGLLGASLWDFWGPLYGTLGGLFMGLWGASLSTEDQK